MSKKHLVIGVVVLLVGYWMLTDPNGLARASKDGVAQVMSVGGDLLDGLIGFIKQFASK